MNYDDLITKMSLIGFDSNYIIIIIDFLHKSSDRILEVKINPKSNKLVINLKGNNDSDSVNVGIPNKINKLVKVDVYRDLSIYQTHIFDNVSEFLSKCKGYSWWNFKPLGLSKSIFNCNFN